MVPSAASRFHAAKPAPAAGKSEKKGAESSGARSAGRAAEAASLEGGGLASLLVPKACVSAERGV